MKRIDISEILIKFLEKVSSYQGAPLNIKKAAENIIMCRTEILGGHEYKCECGAVHTIWNSCHNKSCPICSSMFEEKWLSENQEKIPNVRYAHIVFTFPHELNYVWLGAKEKVTDLFFDTVREVLTEVFEHEYGLTPGIKVFFHSWNSWMNIHLHNHCVMTIGGKTKEGKWEDKKGEYIIPMEAVLLKLRGKLIYKLRGLKKNGTLPNLKEETLNKLKTKKLNVHLCEEYEGNAENIFRYLAKRARGGVFKDVRFYEGVGSNIVMEYKKRGKWEKKILKAEEVIKRFFYHIPESGQKLVRGYGIFAGSKKKELLKVVEEKGHIEVKLKEYKGKVICEKCNREMLPHREIMSLKQEFIKGMIEEGREISGNKIRYMSKKYKIEQLSLEFKKIV